MFWNKKAQEEIMITLILIPVFIVFVMISHVASVTDDQCTKICTSYNMVKYETQKIADIDKCFCKDFDGRIIQETQIKIYPANMTTYIID